MFDWLRIKAGDTQIAVDPALGNLRDFSVRGRDVLHTAHWVAGERSHNAIDRESVAAGPDQSHGAHPDTTRPEITPEVPVERKLAGDFFCAPFGGGGVEGVPAHGWTANSSWSLVSRAENDSVALLKLELDRPVFGARVCKELRLNAGHSAVYQKHIIEGGQGALTYAHHPMLHMREGGHLGFSAKRLALTPDTPLEPAHRLAYPAHSTDLSQFPAASGGSFDLHAYPEAACADASGSGRAGHEDFITLVEAEESRLGWTAVTRRAEGDIVLFLKDPSTAPVTMLWYSNGGRDYAPWDGKHIGVLGVEDGCTAGAMSVAQACAPNAISDTGVSTVLRLSPERRTEIRHAIVTLECPAGWRGVAEVTPVPAQNLLQLTSLDGEQIKVPFDCAFF